MQRPFIVQFGLVTLLAMLGGCLATQGGAPPSGEAGAPNATRPALSDSAIWALTNAEQNMQRARAAFALWTSTQAAYEEVRAAAAAGDSARVIEQARILDEHVELALRQKDYPSTQRR